ncbi:MAG: thiol-disulfide oxidoreductase DCC family protein [Ilumatobacteraceae bacterium]
MNQQIELPALIFDGDCAFCTSSAMKAERWFQIGRVEPWQFANLEELGLTPQQCETALQWVGSDGRVESGHLAVAAAMRYRGSAWGVVGRVLRWPVVSALGGVAYRWIAKNRHRLPGGTPACAMKKPTNRS